MERYITSVSYVDKPFQLRDSHELTMTFTLDEPGETLFDFVGAVPNGDWGVEGRESAFVTLYVDGSYNQDLILFYGEELFPYQRLLGRLEAGEHELKLVFRDEISSSHLDGVAIRKLEIRQVRDDDPEAIFYRHAPLIYGRNINHPYESTFTDTPLLLFYYCDEHEDGSMTLEYHMIFSNEDWGTSSMALMSKWGRTTDIEWVYRVKIDAHGNISEENTAEEYQGPEHVTTPFRGSRMLGSHPVLQAATLNGNVSDQVTSSYRYLLRPAVRLQREVNREAVMNLYPWTYKIMAKEMQRQEKLEFPADAATPLLTDQRNYLFLQMARKSVNGDHCVGRVDVKVKLFGSATWYTSIHDRPELAYDDVDGPFSTTVKLPAGTTIDQIEEIVAAYVPVEDATDDYQIEIPGIRAAFMLGEDYMPIRPILSSSKKVRISPRHPQKTLWAANTGERKSGI
jgi:hypothetical protein